MGEDSFCEYIDAGIDFEQQPFSFHNGLSAECAYVAQTENGGSVGDYSYQIAFGCIFICVLRVLSDFEARFCNARRISELKVGLCTVGFGRYHLNFTGFAL